MFKQTLHILSHAAIALCALLMCFSCIDNRIDGGAYVPQPDEEGNITLQFNTYIPGMKTASRAAGDVDEQITSLDLYLFDNKGGFTGIASAQFTHGNGQYNEEYSSTTGTYTVTIPGNTEYIHFLGNYNAEEEGFNVAENMGRTEAEVIATLVTTQRIYWGRHTLQEINGNSTVVLYRNYAKVKASTTEGSGVEIQGWTLYREPQYGTVAPFDVKKLDNEKDPFAFELGTTGTILPPHAQCITREHNAGNQQAAKENITASSGNTAYWMFEHKDSEFDARVFAIFLIKKGEETRYYKIEILKDTKTSEGGVVIERTPYDIKRNHEYTIHFKNINPDLGYNTFEEAVMHGPANNTSIDIEETIPEIVSAKHTMRIEESDNGSTIRYYKDYTGTKTYTIDNILIYYDGDDCIANGSALNEKALTASWEEEMPGANDDFTFTQVDGKEHTYRLSFTTTGFSEGDNGANHYKTGLIRIREEHEHLLSRFVRVYLGPAISFRPLLISSDIPAVTDERLTILFEIPDETYLPTDLYPIEVRFGSDRVDVEKNLAIESMKIEFDANPYENVLQYTGESNGTYSWQANKTVNNTWGYKFVYTIEQAPQTKDEQKRRVTLRTVNNLTDDFSVLMEGMSTVTGTAIFNKRELEFKMQEESFNRIMLPNGLPETRYVTGYINAVKGAEEISVSYQLGTYDESQGITTADNASATIWVHYNPDELTPKGMTGTGYKDAEGNYFFVHQATSAKDTLTFTPNGEIKNSVVFLTARSNSKYGTYNSRSDYYQMNANGEIEGYGEADYLYTGVNATPYRSAAAIVSVMDEWEFNPAPSATGTSGSYSYANEIAIASGSGSKLYLRIDRPMGQDGVKLKFDTEGKFNLMESEDYTIEEDGTVTLKQNTTSEYCYLTFQATGFNSACTIKMSSVSGSSIPYAPAELTVINSSISFLGFAFANENLLSDSDAISYNDSVNKVLPIKGALLGIRIFLPATMMDQGAFRFNLTSAKFRPVNNESELTTTLTNAARFDYYSVTPSSRNNTTSIISVNENALHADESDNTRCYLDILVETLGNDGTESIKFLGTNEKNDDISFYPYNVSISTQNATYEATVMHSADNSNWTSETLTGVGVGDVIYYQVTLPNLGLQRIGLPITIVHNGYFTLADNSGYTDWNQHEDTLTIHVNSTANATSNIVIPMKITKEFNTHDVPVTVGGNIVSIIENPNVLTLGKETLTPTKIELYSARTTDNGGYTSIYENGTFLNKDYLDIPTQKGEDVKIRMTLDAKVDGQTFELDLNSTGLTLTDSIATAENGVVEFRMTTKDTGTAEVISFKVSSSKYLIPQVQGQTIASWEQLESYVVWWTNDNGERDDEAKGHFIFDRTNEYIAQDVSPTANSVFQNAFPGITSFASHVKMNSNGKVSFYAAEDNMYLIIGAAQRKDDKEPDKYAYPESMVIEYYNSESQQTEQCTTTEKDIFKKASESGTNIITSALEQQVQLGKKGLYTIRRMSGKEFCLSYLYLMPGNPRLTAADFNLSSWEATANNSISGATWSGNITQNRIAVSDFAQKLVLNLGTLEENVNLTVTGSYQIEGDTLVEAGENVTVTLVPTATTDGYLTDGTFTIQGEGVSLHSYNAQEITVYIRPYVTATATLNQSEITNSNSTLNIGETVSLDVTVPAKHAGKDITFKPKAGYNEKSVNNLGAYSVLKYSFPEGNNITTTQQKVEEDQEYIVSISQAEAKTYSYQWIAAKATTPGARMEIRPYGETDIFIDNVFKTERTWQRLTINKYPSTLTFKSATNDAQGYMQYRLYGNIWNYVKAEPYGDNLDPDLKAENKDWNSIRYSILKGSSIDIRITIPDIKIKDQYLVKHTDIALYNGDTQIAVASSEITEEEDGKRYAVFSGISITDNMELHFNSINTTDYQLTQSAKMIINATTEKTWDFSTMSGNMTYYDDANSIKINKKSCQLGKENYEGMAIEGADKFFIHNTLKGLYNGNSGERIIGILNLGINTNVKIVVSETPNGQDTVDEENRLKLVDTTNSTLTSKTTGENKVTYIYNMNGNGTLAFSLKRYYTIYSIEISTPSE